MVPWRPHSQMFKVDFLSRYEGQPLPRWDLQAGDHVTSEKRDNLEEKAGTESTDRPLLKLWSRAVSVSVWTSCSQGARMGNMLSWRSEEDLVVQSLRDLNSCGAAFIRHFDRQEPRLIEIAESFDHITAEVQKLVQEAKAVRLGGAVTAGVGVGLTVLGLAAAPLTGGTSLAVAGAATALTAGGVAVAAEVVGSLKEKGGAKELETLGKEFMRVVGPLNEELKEIKDMSRQLQMDFAKKYLAHKRKKLSDSLQKLADTSGSIDEAVNFINVLIQLVLKLLQQLSTDKEDVELTNKIVESGDQCWKTIRHLRKMKDELQGLTSTAKELC